jgi:hypothetical protein
VGVLPHWPVLMQATEMITIIAEENVVYCSDIATIVALKVTF